MFVPDNLCSMCISCTKIASKFSAVNYIIVIATYAEIFTFLSR